MGYDVDFVDCGGGLGVDYDGTRSSNSESSINYSIQEYVNDCVDTFVQTADKYGIPHPNLITESGRNLSAHHSVLVIDVLETASLPEMPEEFEAKESDHKLVKDLYEIWDNLNPRTMLEDWHDAEQIREEALELFSHGLVDLKTRAEIESMYWSVCHEVNTLAKQMKHVPDELRNIDKLLADKYFCNFSLFQSLPDSWAIDQLFPMIPIQRLNERPTRKCTIQDITCDSDGKIANFVTYNHVSHVLPVHSLRSRSPTISVSSLSVPTKRFSVTSTTCSATPMPSISPSRMASIASTRCLRARPSRRCSTTCSTTRRNLCATWSNG